MELGPRGTGKTFSLRNASFYSFIISGAKVTAASLFVNLATSEVGILGKKDCVVFDEVNASRFDKGLELLAILKDYMASGVFSRGRTEITSECSIIFIGNTDVTDDDLGEIDEAQQMDLADDLLIIPEARTLPVNEEEGKIGDRYLYLSLPQTLQDAAFLDRIHGLIPGWRIPKVTKRAFATRYGFVTDYFCEIMHLLRKDDFNSQLERYTKLTVAGGEITSRDEDGILKIASGLLKLICPHGEFTEAEAAEVLHFACEYRGLVAQQQHHLNPSEFPKRKFGFMLRMM
jgi:ATP-dependent Lon protease